MRRRPAPPRSPGRGRASGDRAAGPPSPHVDVDPPWRPVDTAHAGNGSRAEEGGRDGRRRASCRGRPGRPRRGARPDRDAGRRVIVLEARDRLGGRTWTGDAARDRRRGRVGRDLGPSREPQPAVAAEIERYGLRMDVSPSPTTSVWLIDGRRRTSTPAATPAWRAPSPRSTPPSRRSASGSRDGDGDRRPARLARPRRLGHRLAGRRGRTRPRRSDALLAFAAAMGGGGRRSWRSCPSSWTPSTTATPSTRLVGRSGWRSPAGRGRCRRASPRGLDVRLGHVVRRDRARRR